jgi:ribosomal protein S12 methylthiotransferase
VIPSIRGGLRSRPIDRIIGEVQWLKGRGLIELNLIAQDLAAYGVDLGMPDGLVRLLRAILSETDVPWIRLLYLHPGHITDGLIDLVASQDRILNYLDIPIQHISDPILAAMDRKIGRAGIISLLGKLSERIDGLFLRTSLIVGFPGEGEREFGELLDFVGEARFQHVGVFPYSREEGTRAASMGGRVPKKTAQKRREMLMSLQKEVSHSHNRALVGSAADVLVEGPYGDDGMRLGGRFYGQAPEVDGMVILSEGSAGPGSLVASRFTDAYPYDLAAVAVDR